MKSLLSIFISPLKTFRYLSEKDESENNQTINFLSATIMIGVGLPQLQIISELFKTNKEVGYVFGIVIMVLLGFLMFKYTMPFFYWVIGKVLNGKASRNQVQLVVAYSFIPFLLYLAIGLIMIIPALIFQNPDLIFYRHPVTYYVVWILTLRSLIYGLSYFNQFSYGYGLLTILISTGIFELVRHLIGS